MTLAELAARGALAMFWFQAASVPSDGARGESDAGGAGKTVHEPRSPVRRRARPLRRPKSTNGEKRGKRAPRRSPSSDPAHRT